MHAGENIKATLMGGFFPTKNQPYHKVLGNTLLYSITQKKLMPFLKIIHSKTLERTSIQLQIYSTALEMVLIFLSARTTIRTILRKRKPSQMEYSLERNNLQLYSLLGCCVSEQWWVACLVRTLLNSPSKFFRITKKLMGRNEIMSLKDWCRFTVPNSWGCLNHAAIYGAFE